MSLGKAFNERCKQLLADLKGETDRAAVIIVGAHLDVLLEEALKTALVPSPTSTDSIFDGPNAPLASFSNRIDFCHRLGLISEFSSKSLHVIRRIRNKFAHNIQGCSFSDNAIKSSVEELYKLHQIYNREPDIFSLFGDSTKGKFLISAIMLIGIIQEAHHNLAPKMPKSPEWPYASQKNG